jgi:hypothetical protein
LRKHSYCFLEVFCGPEVGFQVQEVAFGNGLPQLRKRRPGQRIAELERLVSRLAPELDTVKKSVQLLELPTGRRRAVAMAMVARGIPAARICSLLYLPRSSYYYRPVERDDSQLEQAIEQVLKKFPTYGTRRVTHQLRRPPQNLRANCKRVKRVLGQKGRQRILSQSCSSAARAGGVAGEFGCSGRWGYFRLGREGRCGGGGTCGDG